MGRRGFSELLGSISCSHHFCWPRRSSTGDYYQVCLLCGDEYGYDWNTMRRLSRKPTGSAVAKALRQVVRWVPRPRRLSVAGQVQYREMKAESWNRGELENISSSGLLFHCSDVIVIGTLLEIELDMPPEICGGSVPRRVRCVAQIVRTEQREAKSWCAAKLFDYAFVGNSQVPGVTSEPIRGME